MSHEVVKDVAYIGVGGGTIVHSALSDMATTAQQVSMILGCALVFVTLLHRVFMFWKDAKAEVNKNDKLG